MVIKCAKHEGHEIFVRKRISKLLKCNRDRSQVIVRLLEDRENLDHPGIKVEDTLLVEGLVSFNFAHDIVLLVPLDLFGPLKRDYTIFAYWVLWSKLNRVNSIHSKKLN